MKEFAFYLFNENSNLTSSLHPTKVSKHVARCNIAISFQEHVPDSAKWFIVYWPATPGLVKNVCQTRFIVPGNSPVPPATSNTGQTHNILTARNVIGWIVGGSANLADKSQSLYW